MRLRGACDDLENILNGPIALFRHSKLEDTILKRFPQVYFTDM